MANIAAINANSTKVQTVRNSNYKHLFVLLVQNCKFSSN